jgi:predicted ATPase
MLTFHLVFRALLGVFARAEHPLVLFIDDLQWFDGSMLELLEPFIVGSSLHHLLVIGAYREDEVVGAHPLIATIAAIRRARGLITEVSLDPLAPGALSRLLSDMLGHDVRQVTTLANVISRKTAGSPFFSIQFIKELAADRLLIFDPNTSQWTWDHLGIVHKDITDNVGQLSVLAAAESVIWKIRALPSPHSRRKHGNRPAKATAATANRTKSLPAHWLQSHLFNDG